MKKIIFRFPDCPDTPPEYYDNETAEFFVDFMGDEGYSGDRDSDGVTTDVTFEADDIEAIEEAADKYCWWAKDHKLSNDKQMVFDYDEDNNESWGLNEDGRGTYLSDGVWATNPPF